MRSFTSDMFLPNKKPPRSKVWFFLILLGFLGTYLKAQPPVYFGHLPVSPATFCPGSPITIFGTDVYDDPNTVPNCDSLILINTGTLQVYSYHPYNSGNGQGDPNYLGIGTTPIDSIYWVIPNLPNGNYSVQIQDDEDCNNGSFNASVPFSITIAKDVAAVTYPQTSYCVNHPTAITPTNTGTPGGTYSTQFSSLGGNIVMNPSTGQLMLHSGVIGFNQVRYETNASFVGCRDTVDNNITVNPVVTQTLAYDTTRYCQGSGFATVAPPFNPAGGAFSSNPATTALNTSTGAIDLSTVHAGSYAVTYTPGSGTCESPSMVSIQIDSLVAATYDFNPTYCYGSANNTPSSITFLPPGGYFHEAPPATGFLHFLDSITGQIDLNTTQIGTYTIEYLVTGGCINLTSDVITVQPSVDASFTVPTTMCSNVDSVLATPTILGGVFSSPGNLIHFHDDSLGIINVPASNTGGPYTIIYSLPDPSCPDTVQHHVTITDAPTATIQYPSPTFCEKDVDPAALFQLGTAGGTLYISPSGIIDPQSGLIDLDSTGPGTYFISYQVTSAGCTDSFPVDTVAILGMPVTAFTLADTAICQGTGVVPIGSPAPTTGTSVFSMSNSMMNYFTTAIVGTDSIDTDVLPSGGPFRIVRTVDDGSCVDSLVQYIWVLELEDPSFIYAPDTFCQTDRNPVPLILGDGGGTFREVLISQDTLVLDTATGLITLGTSEPGVHYVEYTTGGPCPQIDTFRVVVTSSTSPNFSYGVNSYCETDTAIARPVDLPDPPAFYHFTVSDTHLVMLDSLTGYLDILASDTGVYNVTLTLDSTGGNCPITAQVAIEILAYNNSSIQFDSVVCLTDSFMQIYYDSTLAGVFFAPSGLVWQNRDSGLVAVYASLPGDYVIRYEVQGVCQEKFTDTLTIEVPTYPDFNFPNGDKEFCKSDGFVQAQSADTSGGTYTWVNLQSPGDTSGLVIGAQTGLIDLAASNASTYDITYTTNTACKGDTTKRIIIYPSPLNAHLRVDPNDSICSGVPLTIFSSGAAYTEIRVAGDTTYANSVTVNGLVDGTVVEMVFITQQQCRDSANTTITVFPRPDGTPIIASPTITGNEPIIFQMSSNVDQTSYSWNLDSIGQVSFPRTHDSIPPVDLGSTGQIASTPTLANGFDPAQAIFTIVPWANGCVGDTDVVIIRINPNNQPIFIPEVFTPNGDGSNDTWLLQWNNDIIAAEYTILVFNRSGGKVYTMEGLKDTWSGDDNPDGVYWWQLYHGPDNVLLTGAVTIRRHQQ